MWFRFMSSECYQYIVILNRTNNGDTVSTFITAFKFKVWFCSRKRKHFDKYNKKVGQGHPKIKQHFDKSHIIL